jgi:hypothetical protein
MFYVALTSRALQQMKGLARRWRTATEQTSISLVVLVGRARGMGEEKAMVRAP